MPRFTAIALAILGITAAVAILIVATTPEGDVDSHAYMLFGLLMFAIPAGVVASSAGVVVAVRRQRGILLACVVAALFYAPAVLLLCVLQGWL